MPDRWLPNPAPYPPAPPESWPGPPRGEPYASVPPSPPPSPPGGRGRRRLVLPILLVVLSVLAAALAVVVLPDDEDETAVDDSTRSSTTAPSSSGPPSSAPAESIEAVLDDLVAFVEQERGLRFEQRPKVEVVPDDAFERALAEQVEESRELIQQDETLFRALGLIEPDVELFEAYQRLYAAGVLGFYDPATDELLVRGEGAGPFVRQVVVHELTHALEDQRFDLDRTDLDRAPDESAFGFSALVEGSAKRVENAYVASLSPAEESEAEDEALQFGLGVDPSDVSIPLVALTQAAYTYGERLVEGLVADGQPVLDAAYDQPPVTSEQVVEPDRYAAREPAVGLPAPDADGDVVDRGALGALLIDTVLTGGTGSILGGDLVAAAGGWGGDAFASWRDDEDRSCVRFRVVGDTAADTTELEQAFADWIDGQDGSSVAERSEEGSRRFVEVTSCR